MQYVLLLEIIDFGSFFIGSPISAYGLNIDFSV
jgi:hypothetical protein